MTDTVLPAAPDRVDPPFVAGERAMLESWLDLHRATLLHKCSGLDAATCCFVFRALQPVGKSSWNAMVGWRNRLSSKNPWRGSSP